MNEIDKQPVSIQTEEEQEIDLLELAQKVWAGRKLIIKVCSVALVVGLVVAFSIPKEYTTAVTLAPEAGGKGGAGNLGALASMAGINLSSGAGDEALSPDLYPDIVKSTPFLLDLFPVKVTPMENGKTVTLYEYMDKHQRAPWWGVITSAPFKAIGWISSLFKDEVKPSGDTKPDAFRLTKKQADIAKGISDRIIASVDKKSGVISLSVTMQDPLISAALTDTVMQNLQSYITEYRTNKAKRDLAYTEKLYKEAQQDYYTAQQKYANFADSNLDIVLTGYRTRLERLQNEATLAYGLYNQISQQLQLAKAKVQEVTPVYTVVQPASVPLQPTSPNKIMILFGFIFMAFVGCLGWILFIKDLLSQFRRS
ncbi:MAG: chain-length determining protein [Bacteroidia bacterium]|nr:chain-length determining protein [Bacteroidia bacterium]